MEPSRQTAYQSVPFINPQEAGILRQIFEMYAGGLGITRIAKRLNTENIPAPRQSPRGWAPSALREILYRRLYAGEIVWNEYEKIVRGGTKKRRRRDEKDWIRLDAPDLRIIPPDLWSTVQARLARTKGRGGAALRDVDSKYLLTGMARCAHCGGPMTIVGQDYHRRKGRFYGCAYYKTRGSSICKNSLLVEQEVLDKVLLKSIADVLTEQMLKVAVDKALAQLRAGQGAKLDRRMAIERELSLIGAKKELLVDAIADGNKDPAIRERLNAEETRRQELIIELERLSSADDLSDLNEARLKRDLKARLANTQALLSQQMSTARRLLKTLIDQPLHCEAVREGKERGYRITGTGTYLPLLPEFGCSVESGVPNGI